MGGGEGDEDLGDDSVASESPQPGQIEVAAPELRASGETRDRCNA